MAGVDVGERNGVQVVHRIALILRALRDEPDELTLSQIAKRVGLARSTVYRLITALEHERFVVSAASGRGYRLGPGLASLTVAATRDLTALIHPYLTDLSDELNETVDLVVLEQESVLFIDRVIAPSRQLFVQSHVGAIMPSHSTAPGKALLATLPDAEVERLLPSRLKKITVRTITSRTRLIEELDEVRRTGLAVAREEHSSGICAVAIAVGGEDGAVAAISVPLPAHRFEESEKTIKKALRRTGAAVNALLIT